jgi:uncharacterized membrane protein
MLTLLKENNRFRETALIGTFAVLCFGFSLFRCYYTGTGFFLFLNWNLFLAFIPWALTSLVIINPNIQKAKITIFILLGSWLLFFPNAPYILTDLFHLRFKSSMPIWFDLILILSFAWTGLLFGFFSLWNIEQILAKSFKPHTVTLISVALLFAASFGIYLGRYLRWNSWDVLTEPSGIVYDIGHRFIHPFEHPTTWGMTIFMGVFLCMIYFSLRLVKKRA